MTDRLISIDTDQDAGEQFPAPVRDEIAALTGDAVRVTTYIGNLATPEDAIAAAIVEAATRPNGVVDFEGISYVTTDTVTITSPGVTLQNGGIRPTGQFTAVEVTAADVTVRNMTFSRAITAPYSATITERSCVSVSAARFTSIDCDYLGAAGACVFLSHGTCDGTVIRGGQMTGTPSFQDACGVYAAAGATGNRNITIEGVHIYDSTHGIHLFDTAESLISGNRVESLRMVETIELTGWTLVGGNIYKQRTATGSIPGDDGPSTDRAEGNTNTVYNNGVHMGEVTQGSDSPAANRASVYLGYVYINLNGTNPNTRTITGGIVTGYAFMLYMSAAMQPTPEVISGNRIVDNYCEDIDGYGIYFQFSVNGGAYGNQATGNHLKDVCLEGAQNPSLPFGGIGVVGGTDTLLANNTIDGVGSVGKTVPGVYIYQGSTNTDPSGRMIGMSVRGSLNVGYRIRASNWIVSGCRADDNDNHGFYVSETDSGAKVEGVTLSGCVAQNNAGVGMYVDGLSTAISNISVNIIGGAAIGNTNRGVQIAGSASTTTVTGCSVIGVLSKQNGVSGVQQIILSGAADGITVAGCSMIHSGTAIGLSVGASITNAVAFGNYFSVSTPTSYSATVGDGAAATLVGRALTDPKINAIKDTNGNTSMTLSATASAVNYFHVENKAASGGAIGLYAMGTDANIPIAVWSKGSGTSAGVAFRTLAAGVYFSAQPVTSGVNYLGTTSAVTGAAPPLTAIGSDSNISISLVPKGTGTVQVGSNPVGVKVAVPASAAATGVVGQWAADSGFIYVCTAANTWVRSVAATW